MPHGGNSEVNGFGLAGHILNRINKGHRLSRFYQPLFGLPGEQPTHSLTIVQKDVDPETLGLIAHILEGNLEMERVDTFPFLEKTAEGNQLGLGRNFFVDLLVSGAGRHFLSGVDFHSHTAP